MCSFLVGKLGGRARGCGAASRGGRGTYLQRNAAALALVRKRGGMQSVAFVPPRGEGCGAARGQCTRRLRTSLPPIQYILLMLRLFTILNVKVS